MTQFRILENDIPTMIESLSELFKEYKDEVSPKMLADRMTAKLGRLIHFNKASFMLDCFGFITRRPPEHNNRTSRFIIPDLELLDKIRSDALRCKNRAGLDG